MHSACVDHVSPTQRAGRGAERLRQSLDDPNSLRRRRNSAATSELWQGPALLFHELAVAHRLNGGLSVQGFPEVWRAAILFAVQPDHDFLRLRLFAGSDERH